MKRRTFMRKAAIAGAAIAGAPLARTMSLAQGLSSGRTALPSVHLTQQDFVSTFPWGIRGDKVRILQQEVEDEILDTETLAAMAFMLGFRSSSEQLDKAWTLLLNSHNHDVHVCLRDEVGIQWCQQARIVAAEVLQEASQYMADAVGGGTVALNPASWSRPIGSSEVPAFGYAVVDPSHGSPSTAGDRGDDWNGWSEGREFRLRLREDGCLEAQVGSDGKGRALLGHLTLLANGKNHDSRSPKPTKIEGWLSRDRKDAHALLEGKIGAIAFQQEVSASGECIDIDTTLDYGDGAYFGPEIEDFEKEPRRTHYFQHERKLCMNWQFTDAPTKLLYNSPFLSWPAGNTRSVESLHYVALQAGDV